MIRTLTTASVLGLAGIASAQPVPRALLTTQTGNPLTIIPGTAGVPVSSFTQAQIGLSPSGTYWTIAVNASGQPTTSDTFHLAGTAAAVQRVVPEGVTLPGVGFGITGRPNNQVSVNDSGVMAFKVTTNAPAASNEMVLRFNLDGTYDVIAREGFAIPTVPGESYGGFLDSTTILNDGRVAWRAQSTSGSLPSDRDDFLFLSGSPQTTIVQAGFNTPTNQGGGATALLTGINDEAYINSDATRYLVDATVGTTRAIVVDNDIKIQTGKPITGLGTELPLSIPTDEARMFPGGDWAAWGTGDAGTAFAIVNDALYIKEGDPIPGGMPGETLSTIGEVTMNANGDLAYAARTSISRSVIIVDFVSGDPFLAVSTFNSTFNIPMATQVDYTGDNILDDAYFSFLNDDTIGLSAAGELYFVGRVTSAATGLNLGDGLFVYPLSTATPCPADFNGDTFVDDADFVIFAEAYEIFTVPPANAQADFNADGFVDDADFVDFATAYEAFVCP